MLRFKNSIIPLENPNLEPKYMNLTQLRKQTSIYNETKYDHEQAKASENVPKLQHLQYYLAKSGAVKMRGTS